MPFAVTLLLFILGAMLVIWGGDRFVDAAAAMAKRFHIPAFVIGATIVSVATTLPEMLVSLMAAAQGKADMAIGNAVGSVTANTAMILGIHLLLLPGVLPRKSHGIPCLLLIDSAGVLWLCCLSGRLTLWGSLLLLGLCGGFLYYNVSAAKTTPKAAEGAEKQGFLPFLFFFLGTGGILMGSELLVRCGSRIAYEMGIPERIIAVTLIAIGTSLPELVTAISAIAKKEAALSVGNVIGANILDLTLILPACNLLSGKAVPVSVQAQRVDLPFCLAAILAAALPVLLKEKGYRLQGAVLLLGYSAYLAFLFFL